MLTEIVCIIDRSGSMNSIKDDAIGGFNSFISEQKQIEGQARVTLVFFNHKYEIVYSGLDLNDVPILTAETFKPFGTTALFDAVGRSIDDVMERYSKSEEEKRPSRVIVAILTDGMENASKDYSKNKVAEMVKKQEEEFSWDFMFLAANMDAVEVASTLHIPARNAVQFKSTGRGTKEAYSIMSKMVSKSRMRE